MMNTNPNIDKKISFIGTLISSGKIGEAEPLLQELLKSSGNNSELLHQMGVVKYFQGFYEEAIHYLSSAIKYKKIILTTISGERYHMGEKMTICVQSLIIGNH